MSGKGIKDFISTQLALAHSKVSDSIANNIYSADIRHRTVELTKNELDKLVKNIIKNTINHLNHK
jgi:hypothetical protein